VFCSDTLEHVPQPERALAELERVLTPGGAALLTVPVLWHRPTRVRSEPCGGALRHHLPASYHGSRALAKPEHGHFVFREFGPDLLDQFAQRFDLRTVFLDLWRNPFDCAFVLRRRGA
jgi:SAM-dependent methyltransferase